MMQWGGGAPAPMMAMGGKGKGGGMIRLVRRTALSGGRDLCAAALARPVRSRGVERNRGVPDPGNVLSGDVSCKPMRSFCQPIPQPLWPISVNWGQ